MIMSILTRNCNRMIIEYKWRERGVQRMFEEQEKKQRQITLDDDDDDDETGQRVRDFSFSIDRRY